MSPSTSQPILAVLSTLSTALFISQTKFLANHYLEAKTLSEPDRQGILEDLATLGTDLVVNLPSVQANFILAMPRTLTREKGQEILEELSTFSERRSCQHYQKDAD